MARRLSVYASIGTQAVLCFVGACNTPQPATQPGPLANATQVPNSSGMVELTAGAVAPTATQGGRIVISGQGTSTGIGVPTGIAVATPYPTAGPPDCATADPKLPCYAHFDNDQETVQLPGGDFLVSWSGYSAANPTQFKNTSWYSTWVPAPAPNVGPLNPNGTNIYPVTQRDGIRAAQLLWRYSAQTQQFSWVGALDMATVGATGQNDNLQPAYCAPGVPFTSYGMDRPELYADPWDSQHRVYLSGGCTLATDPFNRQIWTSFDYGADWQNSTIRLPNGLVTAMTSTPDGILYILQYTGEQPPSTAPANAPGFVYVPTLYFSTDHGGSLSQDPNPANSGQPLALDATYNTCGGTPVCQSGGQYLPAQLGFPSGAFKTNVNPLALTAVGPNSVLLVYSAWTPAKLQNAIPVSQQVAPVVMVLGAPNNPLIVPLTVITPAVPGGAVLLPSFITDNRNVGNPVAMLYWLETDPTTSTAKARYMLFLGAGSFPTAAQDLSPSFPIAPMGLSVLPATFLGDYMKGASYITTDSNNNQTVNFTPVWPQTILDSAGNVTINTWTKIVPVSVGATAGFTPPNADRTTPPRIKGPIQPIHRQECDMCVRR
jgi:hypothetical protein